MVKECLQRGTACWLYSDPVMQTLVCIQTGHPIKHINML